MVERTGRRHADRFRPFQCPLKPGCHAVPAVHSIEAELLELRDAGVLEESAAARALAVERREIFSVATELQVALYGSVALVIAGIGILVKEHLDRIGPLTLTLVLALIGAACYVPAIRRRKLHAPRSSASDYLLLLGALILSADLGFAEVQFHLLGRDWSRHLLILAVAHAITAYALDSRLVLSAALASLAGWFGIQRGPWNGLDWHFATPELGLRAMACALGTLGWREFDRHARDRGFSEVFEHFAAHLAFWGAVGWCWGNDPRPTGMIELLPLAGVVSVLTLAAASIGWALHSRKEAFAVYGVVYAAVGSSGVAAKLSGYHPLSSAVALLLIALMAAAALRRLHDALKSNP